MAGSPHPKTTVGAAESDRPPPNPNPNPHNTLNTLIQLETHSTLWTFCSSLINSKQDQTLGQDIKVLKLPPTMTYITNSQEHTVSYIHIVTTNTNFVGSRGIHMAFSQATDRTFSPIEATRKQTRKRMMSTWLTASQNHATPLMGTECPGKTSTSFWWYFQPIWWWFASCFVCLDVCCQVYTQLQRHVNLACRQPFQYWKQGI